MIHIIHYIWVFIFSVLGLQMTNSKTEEQEKVPFQIQPSTVELEPKESSTYFWAPDFNPHTHLKFLKHIDSL